jgi:drug/metabolite transporter (DMT)-like permease
VERRERPVTRRGAVLFAALCVVWGIPYLLIKVAVGEISPVALVFLRTGIATVLLLPLALARGMVRPVLARWRPLLAFVVVEIAVPWLLLSDAERHLTSSLSGLLIAATPLVGAGLALLRRDGDRLGPIGVLGLLVGLLGVAALVGLDVHGSQVTAVLEVAGVAVGYATGPIIMNRSLSDVPSLGVVATSLAICALAYAPFGIPAVPNAWPRASVVVSVVLLAVVCTALAFLLMFGLVAEVGPVRATVITYVNPAVAVAAGVVILDEPLTAATVVGFVLVIAGSVLATYRPGARRAAGQGVPVEPSGQPACAGGEARDSAHPA